MTSLIPSATMLWCHRNGQGQIDALSRQPLTEQDAASASWQQVSSESAEVVVFLHELSSHVNALSQTDVGLARVIEDVVDVLITRGLIQFTDLPVAAQAKLLERRETRASLSNRLDLFPLDGDSGLF